MVYTAIGLVLVIVTGAFVVLVLGAVLYVAATTAYGMLISAFTKTQIAALFGTAILTVLPAIQFSGMMSPVSSLTGAAKYIGLGFPMSYFVPISVGTFTKGLGFHDLTRDLLELAIFPPLLIGLSADVQPILRSASTIFWLGTKELRSFLRDTVLIVLVIYTFSLAVISQAQSNSQELNKASIAVADEDNSPLSRRIMHAFLPPLFLPPQPIAVADIVPSMNAGHFTFVVDFPPHFERDVLAGRSPALQVDVDATAMIQAGLGAGYAGQIINTEIADYLSHAEGVPLSPVNLIVRIAFNPNGTTAWFSSVMGIINNVTMLAIIMSGAAVIREILARNHLV